VAGRWRRGPQLPCRGSQIGTDDRRPRPGGRMRRTGSPWGQWTAAVLAVALLAGACGGSDDDAEGDDAGDEGAEVVDERVESSGDPVPGGTLVYGVGAETDGWNPTQNAWAPEGSQIGKTVYDPLTAFDPEGV